MSEFSYILYFSKNNSYMTLKWIYFRDEGCLRTISANADGDGILRHKCLPYTLQKLLLKLRNDTLASRYAPIFMTKKKMKNMLHERSEIF